MREADVSVLAVGFFDGVHLGHQSILRGADAALTFRNHPLSVLAPDRAPALVMGFDERLAAIRACGVEDVVALDFTPELANMEPSDFLRLVAERHPFSSVRCGANWRFGRGGIGGADWLRAHGVPVDVAPFAMHAGERISSSRIRECLGRGEIGEANAMMGRVLKVAGRTFRGKGLGRSLGFPTVNASSDSPALGLLPRGVYLVETGGVRALANYGVAPTAGDRAWAKPVLEVHFPDGGAPAADAAEDSPIEVSFLRFMRPERRFSSLDELRMQIAADCKDAGFVL